MVKKVGNKKENSPEKTTSKLLDSGEIKNKQLFLPFPTSEEDLSNVHSPNLELKFSPLPYPIWTESKAKLIQKYLRFFCYVTKHGTYIDAFAGPQQPDKPQMWSAKLVLEDEPKRLKNFYLFETDKEKIPLLEKLKQDDSSNSNGDNKKTVKRKIEIHKGDCNILIPRLLETNVIGSSEATFCLLDQRTFECHWSTVEKLAKYPKSDYKIELFYFLAEHWFNRAYSSVKDTKKIEKWWGNKDYSQLEKMKGEQRAELISKRIKSELGYKFVTPWPIYSNEDAVRIKYFMIHASDHPRASSLMHRAYKQAVVDKEITEQLAFSFDEINL